MSSKSRKRKAGQRSYRRWYRELMQRPRKGFLVMKSAEPDEKLLAEFRKHWRGMVEPVMCDIEIRSHYLKVPILPQTLIGR